MNARFAPIPCPLPDERKPGPCSPPPVLEFARAQPDYEMQDDMGEYSQTMPRHREPLEGMLVVDCPEVSHG